MIEYIALYPTAELLSLVGLLEDGPPNVNPPNPVLLAPVGHEVTLPFCITEQTPSFIMPP